MSDFLTIISKLFYFQFIF